MFPSQLNPFEDDEVKQSMAEILAGGQDGFDDGAAPVEQPLPPGPTAPAGPAMPPPQAMPQAAPAAPEPMQAPEPALQAPPRRQSAQGHVDPGMAFMAAFSQNPVLQKMVEESRNRPRVQQDFDNKNAAEGRASEKWQQERDIMAPLKAQGLSQKNALGAASLEGKDPKSAYSGAARENLSQRAQAEAARLSRVDSFMAGQLSRVAERIASGSHLSAEQAEAMLKPFGGLADKIIGDARNASKDAEASKMNEAKIADMSDDNKQAWAKINAARERALTARGPSDRQKAAFAKDQGKLDDEVEKADWARNMLLSVADLKKDVATGPVAGRVQNIAQMWGLSPDKFDTMKSRLTTVTNRIIKELSGSAVTGNEWMRMQDELANILDSDKNFETKLANMIELTESIKQRAINKYARNEDGSPLSPANTAQRVTAGRPKVREGEKTPPDATPGRTPAAAALQDAQDGQRAYSAKAGKYFVRKGGKWVPE